MAKGTEQHTAVHGEPSGNSGQAKKPSNKSRGVPTLARELRVPASRLYNAILEAGVEGVVDGRDAQKVIIVLQQRAVPFRALRRYFGKDMTLQQLADLEKVHVLE